MEVTPTQTVEDSHVWKGLPGDGVCNSAYEACSRVPLDDLVETGKIITPQHGRPMRATMSLCAGISHGNVPLLLKYAFRGVTKANWQSLPIPQGLFDVVAHVFFSIRRFLPETYRSIFPNCFQLVLYRAGQRVGWHQDGTPCPNKSIVDESPVLTTRCRAHTGIRVVAHTAKHVS